MKKLIFYIVMICFVFLANAQDVKFEWGEEFDKNGNSSAWRFYHVISNENGHKFLHSFNGYFWLYSFDKNLQYTKVNVLEKFNIKDLFVQKQYLKKVYSINNKTYALIISNTLEGKAIQEYAHLIEINEDGTFGESVELFSINIEGKNLIGEFILDKSPDGSKLLLIYENIHFEKERDKQVIIKVFDNTLNELWSATELLNFNFRISEVYEEGKTKDKAGFFISNEGEVAFSVTDYKSEIKAGNIYAYSQNGKKILEKKFTENVGRYDFYIQNGTIVVLGLYKKENKYGFLHVFNNGKETVTEIDIDQLTNGKRKNDEMGFNMGKVQFLDLDNNLIIVLQEFFIKMIDNTTYLTQRDLISISLNNNFEVINKEYIPKFQTSIGADEKWRNSSYILVNSNDNFSFIYEAIGKDKNLLSEEDKDEDGLVYQVEFDANGAFTNKKVLMDTKVDLIALRPSTLFKLNEKEYLVISEFKKSARLGKIIIN